MKQVDREKLDAKGKIQDKDEERGDGDTESQRQGKTLDGIDFPAGKNRIG